MPNKKTLNEIIRLEIGNTVICEKLSQKSTTHKRVLGRLLETVDLIEAYYGNIATYIARLSQSVLDLITESFDGDENRVNSWLTSMFESGVKSEVVSAIIRAGTSAKDNASLIRKWEDKPFSSMIKRLDPEYYSYIYYESVESENAKPVARIRKTHLQNPRLFDCDFGKGATNALAAGHLPIKEDR